MKWGSKTGLTGKLGLLREGSKFWMPIGKRVVILGGELVGLELAEFLAKRGRQVTVLEDSSRVGRGLPLVRRFRVIDECHELGVALLTNTADARIGEHSVTYTNDSGQERTIGADTVIVAKGATGDDSVADMLERDGFTVHRVGDCTGVGYTEGAMRDAALATRTI